MEAYGDAVVEALSKRRETANVTETRAVRESPWRRRLRYWLNSFRGFGILDVRGIDDRPR